MKAGKKRKVRKVLITAFIGNGDSDTSIKVGPRKWEAIAAGAEYEVSSWCYYDGRRDRSWWKFRDRHFSLSGPDGMEHFVNSPLEELNVEVVETYSAIGRKKKKKR